MECHECKYSRHIPGDTHLKCCHPSIKERGEFVCVLDFLAGRERCGLNLDVDSRGITNGYVMWPLNFDPIWIRNCDGFTETDGKK